MRRLKLTPHLSLEELAARERAASDTVEQRQWQVLRLLTQGRSTADVIAITSLSATWVYTIVRRYNQEGSDGVGDRRHQNPGAPSLLTPEQRAELAVALDTPHPDDGLWTGPKVAAWMAERLGRSIHAPRGWEVLQQLGYRAYEPRPQHAKADPHKQETFKKNAS